MANRSKRTNRARTRFIEVIKETGNVSEAARVVGLGRQRMYEWRDADASFRAEWDEAIQISTDALEREARRRGYEGFEEPVYYKGEVVGYIRNYSDRMLELLLKAHRPEKFKERVDNVHTGAGGGPIQHHHAGSLTPELLAETVHILQTLGTNGHHES